MDAARKPLGIYLLGSALVVAVHFVFSPFYRDALDPIAVWSVLDWFMAVGIVVAVVVNVRRGLAAERAAGSEAGAAASLAANAAKWLTILLALWFFWNWFDFLTLEADVQAMPNLIMWSFIDPLYAMVAAATGRSLLVDG